MLEDLKEAIRKNLPAQVSEELQGYLKEADLDRKDNVKLRAENESLRAQNQKYQNERIEITSFANEKDVLKQDRQKFEIEKREYYMKVLTEKYHDVKSLMHDVFRNQRLVYKKDINEYVPVKDQYGCSSQQHQHGTHTTEVTEE